MRERIEQGIDYFTHYYGELEHNRWIEQGRPGLMDTTDLHKQAMAEAINQTAEGLCEEIEKVENDLVSIVTIPSEDNNLLKWQYDKGFNDCRQKILGLLRSK